MQRKWKIPNVDSRSSHKHLNQVNEDFCFPLDVLIIEKDFRNRFKQRNKIMFFFSKCGKEKFCLGCTLDCPLDKWFVQDYSVNWPHVCTGRDHNQCFHATSSKPFNAASSTVQDYIDLFEFK